MKFKRALAALLTAISLLASAAQAQTAYLSQQTRAYQYPDTGARSIAVSPGAQVELIETRGEWSKVRRGGTTAYVDSALVLTEQSAGGATAYAARELTLRTGPAQDARAVRTLRAGQRVTVHVTVGEWAGVTLDGARGFVLSAGLTAQGPAAEQTTAVYARYDGVRVYAECSTASAVLGYVNQNGTVYITGTRDGWCRTVSGGRVGYIPQSDLSSAPVEEELQTIMVAYAQRDGVPVYAQDSTASQVLGTLSRNEAVDVCAKNDAWCRVRRGDAVAYVRKADLAPQRAQEETATRAVYVQREGAQVYRGDSTASAVLARLSLNEQLTVLAERGGWARVTNGRSQGYMPLSDLGDAPAQQVEQPETYVTGYVETPGAKVYASASTSAQTLATLSFNATVEVGEIRGDWGKVRSGAQTGYMRMADLSSSRVETITAYAKQSGVQVYAAANTASNVVGTLEVNDEVAIAGANDGWGRAVDGVNVGYILLEQLSQQKTDTTLRPGDSGEAVRELQARLKELGYFEGSLGGNYLTLTQSAVQAFQRAANLPVNGIADEATRRAIFASDAPRYDPADAGYSDATPATGTAKEMDWWTSGIQSIFARGTVVKVTDVETGISWYEKRTGGTNHADVQPLTAADSASMKRAYGGKWSWERRAIFVTIDGVNYAASMNGMPHGSDSISGNGFDGHHCIHFTNSRTHGSNRRDPDHQAAIQRALRATL